MRSIRVVLVLLLATVAGLIAPSAALAAFPCPQVVTPNAMSTSGYIPGYGFESCPTPTTPAETVLANFADAQGTRILMREGFFSYSLANRYGDLDYEGYGRVKVKEAHAGTIETAMIAVKCDPTPKYREDGRVEYKVLGFYIGAGGTQEIVTYVTIADLENYATDGSQLGVITNYPEERGSDNKSRFNDEERAAAIAGIDGGCGSLSTVGR